MFAVIRTGGKQYRVAPNDIIEIEKIAGKPGDIIELSEVILLGGDGGPKTGSPTIAGALVAAEVIEQRRADKITVFKKKRRANYRRKKGHRQALTARNRVDAPDASPARGSKWPRSGRVSSARTGPVVVSNDGHAVA